MSIKLAIEHARKDYIEIDPKDIKFNQAKNGRTEPHTDEEILSLVRQYERDGQLQPVGGRRLDDNTLELTFGYRRTLAGIKYNELHPDTPMKLKVIPGICNDLQAFCRNVSENHNRKGLSPVDYALNQERFRKEFSWTEEQICEYFDHSQGYVSQLKKILLLSTEEQLKLHRGQMSVQAAFELSAMPAAERTETIAAATAPDGKVETKKVVQKSRASKAKKGQKVARSVSEIRDFFKVFGGTQTEPYQKVLAGLMVEFVSGKHTDEDITAGINSCFAMAQACKPVAVATPVVVTPVAVVEPVTPTLIAIEPGTLVEAPVAVVEETPAGAPVDIVAEVVAEQLAA